MWLYAAVVSADVESDAGIVVAAVAVAAGRVGNFRQKNNSAEDGIDGTNGYFRRNSGCSAEQNLGIPFRTLPWN